MNGTRCSPHGQLLSSPGRRPPTGCGPVVTFKKIWGFPKSGVPNNGWFMKPWNWMSVPGLPSQVAATLIPWKWSQMTIQESSWVVSTPLKKIWKSVCWDDYSQYIGKIRPVPNHQPSMGKTIIDHPQVHYETIPEWMVYDCFTTIVRYGGFPNS